MLDSNEIIINWEKSPSPEGEVPNSQKGKDVVDLDLNYPPVLSLAVTPSYMDPRKYLAEVQTSKDFGIIDDEVVIISPRRFVEVCTCFSCHDSLYSDLHSYKPIYSCFQAKNNSRRNAEVRETVAAETEVNNGHSGLLADFLKIIECIWFDGCNHVANYITLSILFVRLHGT